MSICTVFVLELLLMAFTQATHQVVFSASIQCANRFFPIDNTCKMCPAHCKSCTNATQCSLCQMGYYGPICQNTCEIGCSGTCHKLYGHCTYGCPDGKYADDKSPACLNCSSQCKICSSLTSCVECNSGYYGRTCLKSCSEHCKEGLCNLTDGTCFECENGSYKMDKECVLCPDGCAHCNNSHKCTVCKSGFIGPVHGMCLLDCPIMSGDEPKSLCHPGLCRNLPPYWKLQIDECNQAHPSDCVTEGVCVVLKSRQVTAERTSDNLDSSLLYMHFKCLFECLEHATLNLTDPCKGQICKIKCVLETPLYSDTYAIANYYRNGDTAPLETSTNSQCTLVTSSATTDKSVTTADTLVVVIIVLVIMLITLVIILIYRIRLANQKQSSKKNPHWDEITGSDDGPHAKRVDTASNYDAHIRESMLQKSVKDCSIEQAYCGKETQYF